MATATFENLSKQIDMLSYSDRIRLLERIVRSLNVPKDRKKTQTSNPEDVFGIWKERDITIESIREKAWNRLSIEV